MKKHQEKHTFHFHGMKKRNGKFQIYLLKFCSLVHRPVFANVTGIMVARSMNAAKCITGSITVM